MMNVSHRFGGSSAISSRQARGFFTRDQLLSIVVALPFAASSGGCMITEYPPEGEVTPSTEPTLTPTPDGVTPTPLPDVAPTPLDASSPGFRSVANQTIDLDRPAVLEVPLAGTISITVQSMSSTCPIKGSAVIEVYPGEGVTGSPLLTLGGSSSLPTCLDGVLTFRFDTLATSTTAQAGSSPEKEDAFTLLYREVDLSSLTQAEDRLLLTLDNQKPVSGLFAMCADSAGRECLYLVDSASSPADQPDDLIISRSDWKTLYLFGVAADANFSYYTFNQMGPGTSEKLYVCQGGLNGNATCTGETELPSPSGYGISRDQAGNTTFVEDAMDTTQSSPYLLLSIDLGDAPTGGWTLQLLTYSLTLKNDGASYESNERFVSFFVTN